MKCDNLCCRETHEEYWKDSDNLGEKPKSQWYTQKGRKRDA